MERSTRRHEHGKVNSATPFLGGWGWGGTQIKKNKTQKDEADICTTHHSVTFYTAEKNVHVTITPAPSLKKKKKQEEEEKKKKKKKTTKKRPHSTLSVSAQFYVPNISTFICGTTLKGGDSLKTLS